MTASAGDDTYQGRPIAPVMGWQGAPWLEREGREAEEDTPTLMRKLRVKPGQTVLDLGCGSGFHARRLAPLVGDTGKVLCVDLQPEMLEIAERFARGAGITNIEFVRGPARCGSRARR